MSALQAFFREEEVTCGQNVTFGCRGPREIPAPINLYPIVHRRIIVTFHGVRLTGRVVAAGWKTPLVVYRGDRTPLQFIVIAPDGTPTALSTNPTDTIEIGVHSPMWNEIEWDPIKQN